VNWNKKDYVLNLLDSILEMTYSNFLIVVVDNASTDGSVPKIKEHDLPVHLIENIENLGGTGGFNTGIRYALNELHQDYVWLLDNDAEVTPNTLEELVKAMEGDASIGIAGSCIMSPEDRSLTVEAGAFVDWRAGTWRPNFRYQRYEDLKADNVISVDYVAACSALVRDAIVRKLGGMDDRYFLHWDDIDFCLCIKDLGYNCVSVMSSQIYHGVEKGFNPNVLYYDFRNGLLTISKHLYGWKRVRSYITLCFNAFASMFFERMSNNKAMARLILSSITDFIAGHFGKGASVSIVNDVSINLLCDDETVKKHFHNIIVFTDGAYDDIVMTLNKIRAIAPNSRITLFSSSERYGILEHMNTDSTIIANNMNNNLYTKAKTGLKILLSGFDSGVSCVPNFTSEYAYFLKKHLVYDSSKDVFYNSNKSLYSIWKIFVAIFFGMVAMLFTLPVVWIAGLREKRD